MSKQFIARPTSMGLALVNAVIKVAQHETADHQKGKGNWIARKVALADDGVGIVQEPAWNAHLKLKTYQELKSKGIMP